jgi:hypothetical protein
MLTTWKKYQSELPARGQIEEWFSIPANIALLTGSTNNKLAVLDIDDLDLAERIKSDESLAGTLIIQTPSGGLHIYLQEEAPSRSGPLIPGVADLKAEGGYVLIPPSEIDAGEYTVLVNGRRLHVASARVWSLDFLAKYGFEPADEKDDLRDGGSKVIREGTRNTTLHKLGSVLRRSGLGYKEIAASLQAVNETRCVPPLASDEVDGIARSASRYETVVDTAALPEPMNAATFISIKSSPTKWLVDTILKTNGHHVWSGAPGAAKSWAAMDLGLAVASGQDFIGHSTVPGAVLFIDDDNIRDTYNERLALLAAGRNLDWPTLPLFFLVQSGIDLGQTQWVEHIIRHIQENNIRLVVIEVLRRVFSGDENSSKDIGLLHKNLARIRNETGVTVVLTHHVGKGGGVVTRGSSDIDAMADVQMGFRKAGSGYLIRESKNRWRKDNREWSFELQESNGAIALVTSGEKSRNAADNEEATLVEQCVDEL